MSRITHLVRPNIAALTPYSTARDEYGGPIGIFLDANESPYENGYNRYPDPHQAALKARIGTIKGIPAENLFLGNGSDEAIDLVFRVFCIPGKDNAVIMAPSYGMYGVAADINDIAVRTVRLEADFSLDSEKLLAACDADTKVIFLCSPNNPSGNAFAQEEILELVQKFPGVVVLDEAYADFSARGSLKKLLEEYPRLIILQTLSKAWGMAGLRLGMALADSAVVRLFNRVRYPYNIGTDTLQLALELLPKSYVESKVSIIVKERERVRAALAEIPTIREVLPSDANFFLIRTDCPRCLYNFLLSRGIIVRDRSNTPLCGPALRLTIGNPGENDKLIKAISEYDSIQSTIH